MSGRSREASHDVVLEALSSLVQALEHNVELSQLAIQRAKAVAALRTKGLTYRDIVNETGKPLVVEIVTANLQRLTVTGAALRHAEAKALHDEGLTMQQIADLYGVSRQRISAVLRGGQ
jgi:transcriptional regulator with XRE-family HTH domain